MIININIDIELNNDQIYLLRKFYIDKSTKQFWGREPLSAHPDLDKSIAESLVDKDILKKDNMFNYTLTILGHSIIDKIDRNKIIDRIINNE
jgi:hypothetical protein